MTTPGRSPRAAPQDAPLDLSADRPDTTPAPEPAPSAEIEAELPEPARQVAAGAEPDSFNAHEWLQRLTPAAPEPEPAWSAALAEAPAVLLEEAPDLALHQPEADPPVRSANGLRRAFAALRSAVALIGSLWRSRKDPPPPPRKRFPPR